MGVFNAVMVARFPAECALGAALDRSIQELESGCERDRIAALDDQCDRDSRQPTLLARELPGVYVEVYGDGAAQPQVGLRPPFLMAHKIAADAGVRIHRDDELGE